MGISNNTINMGRRMQKKDKVIDDLIKAIGDEIDYWMGAKNVELRKAEYGEKVYAKLHARHRDLRMKFFEAILPLAETRSAMPDQTNSDKINV